MTDLNDELTAVLDKEVAILERGDFDELDALIADKERLINQVLEQNVAVDQALKSKLERSQSLLSASIEGVRLVQERIHSIRKVHGSISFYSASGQCHEKQLGQAQKLSKRS